MNPQRTDRRHGGGPTTDAVPMLRNDIDVCMPLLLTRSRYRNNELAVFFSDKVFAGTG